MPCSFIEKENQLVSNKKNQASHLKTLKIKSEKMLILKEGYTQQFKLSKLLGLAEVGLSIVFQILNENTLPKNLVTLST